MNYQESGSRNCGKNFHRSVVVLKVKLGQDDDGEESKFDFGMQSDVEKISLKTDHGSKVDTNYALDVMSVIHDCLEYY